MIHLGFVHDFDRFAESGRIERAVVETIGDTLAGSDRPFLLAAGVAGIAPGRVVTEDDPTTAVGPDAPRGGSEALALSYADRGVRSVALRFAASVHGIGDHGFVATLAQIARDRGTSGYIGDGANRWPAVHRSDAARLVALALDAAPAGSVVHAVGEEGVPTRDIAEALGRSLGLPTDSVAPEDAGDAFGWMARFFGLDAPTSSVLTQERYGWTPTGPTLLDDIAAGGYLPGPDGRRRARSRRPGRTRPGRRTSSGRAGPRVVGRRHERHHPRDRDHGLRRRRHPRARGAPRHRVEPHPRQGCAAR
ncbi:hypothetical protein GCM10025864_32400 [Luteimicrobium album]|uniref:3-beta hydroxysteroid dehydrogenase n=1 Tax=Luteimicrobium album TaxID=1054550 RepID=A0ABQ6I436_9MICO|nr:hypothetical protein GCM10025864_32400 [Luteimicrobium album]